MKNLFYILILSLLSNYSFAQTQVPNPSFDLWTPNDLNPVGWATYESINNNNTFGLATKETVDVVSGPAALKLHTAAIGAQVVPGIAILGENTKIQGGQIVNDGAPFTGRPDSIHLIFKYNATGSDTGLIEIYLENEDSLILDFSRVLFEVSPDWTYETYALADLYESELAPTTIYGLIFNSLFSGSNLTTTLTLDGIFFTSAGSASNLLGQKIPEVIASISPNPASDILTLSSEASIEGFKILIFNSAGKLVLSDEAAKSTRMDIKNIPSGTYNIIMMDLKSDPVYRSKFVKI
ncbi:MAG TPA: T9SS type A sorting domain-containing protein [Saprospiraceae bacterium]|nr:T9SS type A sorting domain-containing protein [Saprospiraceae bacterium]